MEDKRETQCTMCIHKGICKNEERFRDAIEIWTRNEVDQNNEIIYQILVSCPNQLTYSDVEYEITMQRDYERREAERDDW